MTMLGFLIDEEEFEVKPAISRVLLLTEFIDSPNYEKKVVNKGIDVTTSIFTGDCIQTVFSVGEPIGFLFYVAVNGLTQEKNVDYFHIAGTSRITFSFPPCDDAKIAITYYGGKTSIFLDEYGSTLYPDNESFVYDGICHETNPDELTFTVLHTITSIIHVEINGIINIEGSDFIISGDKSIRLLYAPPVGSTVGVCYVHY
jgi:hypothetical protein